MASDQGRDEQGVRVLFIDSRAVFFNEALLLTSIYSHLTLEQSSVFDVLSQIIDENTTYREREEVVFCRTTSFDYHRNGSIPITTSRSSDR